jgi:hypothetical protein
MTSNNIITWWFETTCVQRTRVTGSWLCAILFSWIINTTWRKCWKCYEWNRMQHNDRESYWLREVKCSHSKGRSWAHINRGLIWIMALCVFPPITDLDVLFTAHIAISNVTMCAVMKIITYSTHGGHDLTIIKKVPQMCQFIPKEGAIRS